MVNGENGENQENQIVEKQLLKLKQLNNNNINGY